jgi:hypothetical protein
MSKFHLRPSWWPDSFSDYDLSSNWREHIRGNDIEDVETSFEDIQRWWVISIWEWLREDYHVFHKYSQNVFGLKDTISKNLKSGEWEYKNWNSNNWFTLLEIKKEENKGKICLYTEQLNLYLQ